MAEWDEWEEAVSHPPPSTPTNIVNNVQGASGVEELHFPSSPSDAENKERTNKNKNVKKRGKAALVKVDPGQTTLDSFVVKKKKCLEKDTVAHFVSEEERNCMLMLDDEEYLEKQMRFQKIKREKLKWVGAVTMINENTIHMDREVCVRAGGVEVVNISTECTSSISISVSRTDENINECVLDERIQPRSVCTACIARCKDKQAGAVAV